MSFETDSSKIQKVNNILVDKLPKSIYFTDDCTVCYSEMYDFVYIGSCGHTLCNECFLLIKQSNNLCPYCKRNMDNTILCSFSKPSLPNSTLLDDIIYEFGDYTGEFTKPSLLEHDDYRVWNSVSKLSTNTIYYTEFMVLNSSQTIPNLSFIIDVSFSMEHSLSSVKTKFIEFVNSLDDAVISITTFSDDPKLILPPTVVKSSKQLIISAIDSLKVEGGTYLGKALQYHQDIVIPLCTQKPSIIIVSDGQTHYADQKLSISLFNQTKTNFPTTLIGFGENMVYNDNLKLVGDAMYYYHANDANELILHINAGCGEKHSILIDGTAYVLGNKYTDHTLYVAQNTKIGVLSFEPITIRYKDRIINDTVHSRVPAPHILSAVYNLLINTQLSEINKLSNTDLLAARKQAHAIKKYIDQKNIIRENHENILEVYKNVRKYLISLINSKYGVDELRYESNEAYRNLSNNYTMLARTASQPLDY